MEITKPELKKYLRSIGVSVKGNHISKKDILAAFRQKGTIKTNEPIKIEWEYVDEMLIIKVDGIDYVIIDYVDDLEEIDMDNVQNWIEETYYSDDYKCDARMPARFNVKEFKKSSPK